MKINIGHLIKYSLFLAQILSLYLIYRYSIIPTTTLPNSIPETLPLNQATSVGVAHVIGSFIVRPTYRPDPNDLIIKFYIGVVSITSATAILYQIRKSHHIPIQRSVRKLLTRCKADFST